MPDSNVVIQCVIVQRNQQPTGWRILTDGRVQRTATDNPVPDPDEILEKDRMLTWLDGRSLSAAEIAEVKTAVEQSGFFDLQPRLLINYCKEDPGTAIWTANVDGHQARVVLYDPKPKRSAELDTLTARLSPFWT